MPYYSFILIYYNEYAKVSIRIRIKVILAFFTRNNGIIG